MHTTLVTMSAFLLAVSGACQAGSLTFAWDWDGPPTACVLTVAHAAGQGQQILTGDHATCGTSAPRRRPQTLCATTACPPPGLTHGVVQATSGPGAGMPSHVLSASIGNTPCSWTPLEASQLSPSPEDVAESLPPDTPEDAVTMPPATPDAARRQPRPRYHHRASRQRSTP